MSPRRPSGTTPWIDRRPKPGSRRAARGRRCRRRQSGAEVERSPAWHRPGLPRGAAVGGVAQCNDTRLGRGARREDVRPGGRDPGQLHPLGRRSGAHHVGKARTADGAPRCAGVQGLLHGQRARNGRPASGRRPVARTHQGPHIGADRADVVDDRTDRSRMPGDPAVAGDPQRCRPVRLGRPSPEVAVCAFEFELARIPVALPVAGRKTAVLHAPVSPPSAVVARMASPRCAASGIRRARPRRPR